jgi:LDH2 family malate/lactate/ureidoglycolate dehydrogenase
MLRASCDKGSAIAMMVELLADVEVRGHCRRTISTAARATVARRRKGRRLAHCDRAAFLVPTAQAQKKAPPFARRGSLR